MLIAHTSGTTALPKRVPITHRMQLAAARARNRLRGFAPDDAGLLLAPGSAVMFLTNFVTMLADWRRHDPRHAARAIALPPCQRGLAADMVPGQPRALQRHAAAVIRDQPANRQSPAAPGQLGRRRHGPRPDRAARARLWRAVRQHLRHVRGQRHRRARRAGDRPDRAPSVPSPPASCAWSTAAGNRCRTGRAEKSSCAVRMSSVAIWMIPRRPGRPSTPVAGSAPAISVISTPMACSP